MRLPKNMASLLDSSMQEQGVPKSRPIPPSHPLQYYFTRQTKLAILSSWYLQRRNLQRRNLQQPYCSSTLDWNFKHRDPVWPTLAKLLFPVCIPAATSSSYDDKGSCGDASFLETSAALPTLSAPPHIVPGDYAYLIALIF